MLGEMKKRLPDVQGEEQDSLLLALLDDAGAMIQNLTWRSEVPGALKNAQVRLAILLYNRLGAEGETARTEGDVQRAFDALPQDVKKEILSCRMARTGGV